MGGRPWWGGCGGGLGGRRGGGGGVERGPGAPGGGPRPGRGVLLFGDRRVTFPYSAFFLFLAGAWAAAVTVAVPASFWSRARRATWPTGGFCWPLSLMPTYSTRVLPVSLTSVLSGSFFLPSV